MMFVGTQQDLKRLIAEHGLVDIPRKVGRRHRNLYLCEECGAIVDSNDPEKIWFDDEGVYCEIHGRAKAVGICAHTLKPKPSHVMGRG